jgi:hypothetical protein
MTWTGCAASATCSTPGSISPASAMVMDLQDENTQLRADKEEQQWLTTASIPATRSPTRTSSSSKPRSTRR